MIELPEAMVLAKQLNDTVAGRRITKVIAFHTPHKLAWCFGDPRHYDGLLSGTSIDGATSYGGQVEISAGTMRILFSDGVNLRYFAPGQTLPEKHQLLMELDDGSCMVGSIQMYGGLSAFPEGANDNSYYLAAKAKPSPLSKAFDERYFDSLFDKHALTLSLKGFLATEQRIPGIGNGVLQDILFNARMNPRMRADVLSNADRTRLRASITSTLAEMVDGGGRDTENDLFGRPGGYRTMMSRNTAGKPCPVCGTPIRKEAYMGGSVYYCPACQPV